MVSPLPLDAWCLVPPDISVVVATVWAPLADYLFDLGEFSLIFNLIFAYWS